MRITCDVDVCNRLLPSFNIKNKSKAARTQLSIGKKPGATSKDDDVYLMLCTKQDRNGVKYKLKGNIEKFFTKYVSDGKATIRFKNPPHDICLSKADPIQLKGFLAVLLMGSKGESLKPVTLTTLTPASAKQVEKLKMSLTITSMRDYPITKNFPPGLEALNIHQCNLRKIDSRILSLRHLTKLNLSQNHIKDLPEHFDGVPKLAELILADNQITCIPKAFCVGSLSKSLAHLDLAKNRIQFLKPHFCKLKNLITLKLDDNELVVLPYGIGKLRQLRHLTAANNQLKTLPAGFTCLQLDHLDLSGNAFLKGGPDTAINRLGVPALVEWCARTITKHRIPYSQNEVGPLYDFLNTKRLCLCGSYSFRSHVHYLAAIDLRNVSASVTAVQNGGGTTAPCEAFLCSEACFEKYKRNPYATIWK